MFKVFAWWQLGPNGMLYLMYLMYLTMHAWCTVTWPLGLQLCVCSLHVRQVGHQRVCFGRQCPGGLATLPKGVPIMHLDKGRHCQKSVV